MKGLVQFFLLMMITGTGFIISCSKKSDDPPQFERKKDAWVTGFKDSTGYGMILHSADSGETWLRQGLGSDALNNIDVFDIWAVDANTVWAVCSDNVLLKTLDGGTIWTRVNVPDNKSKATLSAISIVNKNNIWISGSGGTVYNSNDNGNTWTRFDTAIFHNGLMQGICAISPVKVYVVGGVGKNSSHIRGFIGFTLDGGATWDTVFPADDYNRNEWIGVASSGNTIVIYGGKSHYMVSTDGGSTWKNDSAEAGGGGGKGDFNHLIMLDNKTWWSAMDMGQILLTTDGGATWISQLHILGGEFMFGIDAYDSHFALAVGTLASWPPSGPIVKTSDGGANWELKKSYRSNLNKVTFIKP